MSDKDTITLPREVVQEAVKALEFAERNHDGEQSLYTTEIAALRKALAAEQPEPSGYAYRYADGVLRLNDGSQLNGGWPVEAVPYWFAPPAAVPPATHPGYVIGSHWLETAYSRICAGEAEADVLRDCGWERVDEALRRDAERYRWLRDNAAGFSGRTLDAAIDAAIKGDKT